MPVVETARITRSLPVMDVQSFSFHGKGRRAKPKKGDYRQTFYTTVNGVFKGKIQVIRLASGKGYSVHNLETREAPVYLTGDADVVLFYKNGTVDTVSLDSVWEHFSK